MSQSNSNVSSVESKYRGKAEYMLVYSELIRAAQFRGTITYQDIAQIMGLPTRGSYMGKEVGQILGEISDDEHQCHRPMLSAVAVDVKGKPGSGFYVLARRLGKLGEVSKDEELSFWKDERDQVYETWQKHYCK